MFRHCMLGLLLTLAVVGISSRNGFSQEGASSLPSTYHQSSNMTFTMATPDGLTETVVMMPVPGGMPADESQLVNFPNVMDDLELVEAQRSDLKQGLSAVNEKYRPKMDELLKKLYQAVPDGNANDIQKEMSDLQARHKAELKQAIEETLLPFQVRRLKEISARARLANEGTGFLQSKDLANELELTDEQIKQLHVKQQEMETHLQEEFKALRKKRQRQVIDSVLSKTQQEKLDLMLGSELAPSKQFQTRPFVPGKDH